MTLRGPARPARAVVVTVVTRPLGLEMGVDRLGDGLIRAVASCW